MNDDNMDELFRRAASDYPLKTNSGNWEKVETVVQMEKSNSAAEDKNAAKTSNRKYLWLLLLLPMIWICNSRIFMNDSKQSENGVDGGRKQQSESIAAQKDENKNKINQKTAAQNEKVSNDQINSPAKSTKYGPGRINQVKILPPGAIVKNNSSTSSSELRKTNFTDSQSGDLIKTNRHGNKIDKKSSLSYGNKRDERLTKDNADFARASGDVAKKNEPTAAAAKEVNPEIKGKTIKSEESNDSRNDNAKDVESSEKNIKTNNKILSNKAYSDSGISRNQLNIPAELKSVKKDSLQKQIARNVSKISTNKNKVHTLYAGVLTGFDVSTVEFQSVKNTGYSAGILIGYQLNRKLSLESGLLLDKKFYYTDGQYFSLKKINVPATFSLLSANGNCYMFELPINIKYTWTSTSKSSWFSTAGLSSYFMKKEDYSYTYEDSGWASTGSKSYNNSSTNWFGVINISGGYMHTIGKTGTLRVEPYLKVPIERLGIGSLSIWSTGVYVSFIKNIFTK